MARQEASNASSPSSCAVCGMTDARALVTGKLFGSEVVTLCGNHDLMHRRDGKPAASVGELRERFGDRRSMDRRATGDVDELAASLSSAFVQERRQSDRRS